MTTTPADKATDERDVEIARLRASNRELHRRAQQIEAPAQSYAQRLAHIGDVSGQAWVREFDRLIGSHTEVKRIFQELARVFEYPMNAQCFHSVMDSNCESPKDKVDGAVYANCLLSKTGGIKSYRVLDEVRRAVDELISVRTALAAGAPVQQSEPVLQVRSVLFQNAWHDVPREEFDRCVANGAQVRTMFAAPDQTTTGEKK